MDIELEDEHTVEIGSSHLRITVNISESFELVLEDEGDLLDISPGLHFSRPVFYGLEEIRRLKAEAHPTLNQHNRDRDAAEYSSEQTS